MAMVVGVQCFWLGRVYTSSQALSLLLPFNNTFSPIVIALFLSHKFQLGELSLVFPIFKGFNF